MLLGRYVARQRAGVNGLREHLYSPKTSCSRRWEFVPATGKINLPGGTEKMYRGNVQP